MIYKIYLYKPSKYHNDEAKIYSAVCELENNDLKVNNSVFRGMSSFKVNNVINEIYSLPALSNAEGNRHKYKCTIKAESVFSDDGDEKSFIFITTSYDNAPSVLPWIYAVAETNGLALYDAEREKVFFKTISNNTLSHARRREKEINELILKRQKSCGL